ncbi:MAG: hypothetical protein K9L78_03475 [Victivallales bacterium]|nr:hypothetical protein [Victivallales bacterium]
MKKNIIIILFSSLIFTLVFTFNSAASETIEPLNPIQSQNRQPQPQEQKTYYSESSGSVPLRLCFLPEVWYWPRGLNVYGLNLGLPISYGEGENMYGLDFALIASMTDGVKGVQASLVNKGYIADGGEIAIVNFAERLTGFQIGAVNSQISSDAVQLGIINMSQSSNGLQLGLLNMMDNGFLPIFPLINFSM